MGAWDLKAWEPVTLGRWLALGSAWEPLEGERWSLGRPWEARTPLQQGFALGALRALPLGALVALGAL